MVAAMDDVNIVALSSWFRFRMKSCGWLAAAPRRLEFAISTYLEKAGQVGAAISPSMNASAKPMSANCWREQSPCPVVTNFSLNYQDVAAKPAIVASFYKRICYN
jgi:hypothetical protein